MEIRTEIDIKRLERFLKHKLAKGDTIAFHLERMDSPTNKQLRMINAIPRDLAIQSAERGVSGLTCKDFRNMIIDIFLSDYFEVSPDGNLIVKPASFKYGLSKQELSNIISSTIEYFNTYYNFNLCVKEPVSEPINSLHTSPKT